MDGMDALCFCGFWGVHRVYATQTRPAADRKGTEKTAKVGARASGGCRPWGARKPLGERRILCGEELGGMAVLASEVQMRIYHIRERANRLSEPRG